MSKKSKQQKKSTKNKQTVQQKVAKYQIGLFSEAPEYNQSNQHIQSGYRINFNSARHILKSLFMVHNESVNIWTHLIGAIVIIIFMVYFLTSFSNIDYYRWKSILTSSINEQLNPIYEECNQILDKQIYQNAQRIKEDIFDIERSLYQKFNNFKDELNQLKDQLTPDNVSILVQKFNELSLKDYYNELEFHVVEEYKMKILSSIDIIRSNLISQIDSHEFDWLDFHLKDYLGINYIENQDNVSKGQTHIISRWPIFVFLLSAVLCLSFSATFHLFYALSNTYYKVFLRLDYAGVSLLISGSSFPVFYYGFYCNQTYALLYLSTICIASICVFLVSMQNFIHTAPYLTIKSVMYASLGIFAAVPLIHLIYLQIFNDQSIDSYKMGNSLIYYLIMGACYLGGLTIYTKQCPEKYNPGKFDICGSSHQLWHISILLAILFTYIGALINFYTRKMSKCG